MHGNDILVGPGGPHHVVGKYQLTAQPCLERTRAAHTQPGPLLAFAVHVAEAVGHRVAIRTKDRAEGKRPLHEGLGRRTTPGDLALLARIDLVRARLDGSSGLLDGVAPAKPAAALAVEGTQHPRVTEKTKGPTSGTGLAEATAPIFFQRQQVCRLRQHEGIDRSPQLAVDELAEHTRQLSGGKVVFVLHERGQRGDGLGLTSALAKVRAFFLDQAVPHAACRPREAGYRRECQQHRRQAAPQARPPDDHGQSIAVISSEPRRETRVAWTRAKPAGPRDLRRPCLHPLGPSALALAGSAASREGLGTLPGCPSTNACEACRLSR